MSHVSSGNVFAVLDTTSGRWLDANGKTDLFHEHSPWYLQSFPTSGSMRNGTASARPTSAHHTPGSVSSLLPTPTASDRNGIGDHGDGAGDLRSTVALLPTPTAYDSTRGGTQTPEKRREGGHQPSLADIVVHL